MSTKIENKIAEIFYEQLKGIFSIDAISALEAIKDMIDDRDNMIKELRDKLNSLTHNKPVENMPEIYNKCPFCNQKIDIRDIEKCNGISVLVKKLGSNGTL